MINHLSSEDGRAALQMIGFERAQTLFPEDVLITSQNIVTRMIANLDSDAVFNNLFTN